MGEHSDGSKFTVLMVCTGNICRSPVAEQLLISRLEEIGIAAVVHSAGTGALAGQSMTREAEIVAQTYGGTGGGHTARQLTEGLVSSADLILTATREHRSAVVGLHPRAARYCFTLNQFARLLVPVMNSGLLSSNNSVTLGDSDSSKLRLLVAEVAATRGFSPPPAQPTDDDVKDPYRQSLEVYTNVGRAIHAAVSAISGAFASVTGRMCTPTSAP